MGMRGVVVAVVILASAPPVFAAAKGPLDTEVCVAAKKKLEADVAESSKDVDVRATGVCMFYPQLITKAKAKAQYLTTCPAADEGGQLAAAQAEITANEEKMRGCGKK